MITREKLIAVGAEKLADILLSLYENNLDMQKPLDITFAGLDEDPKKLISVIKKEISSIKRSTKFVDYYESDRLANRLDQLRLSIAGELTQKSPPQAMELMLAFVDLQEATLNRADDSNGSVGDVFKESCADLGKICALVPMPVEEVVDIVFIRFMNNGFGIYDQIIHNFKDALKEEGLDLLQNKIENAPAQKHSFHLKHGLESIADCRGDVDAYIRACSINGKTNDHDHLDIARRLIEHWRSEEALQWLNTMNLPKNHSWQEDRHRLKIQAYELCGKYKEAQTERLEWFEENLNTEVYNHILNNAQPEFKEPFKKEAIEKAFQFPEPHAAIRFLMQIQEFDEGAKFARTKIGQLDGGQYYILRPIADILRDTDPLAATLMYRKLAEPVLEKAKSKYYNYAAKDLVSCGVLSSAITAWETHQNHDSYFTSLEVKHKRKLGFWAEYKSALQKQAAKEVKQLTRKMG